MSESGNRILSLTFNHSNTLLYIGTSQGFRVFRLEDSKIISRRDRLTSIHFLGGFKSVIPLYDSQRVALIGSQSNLKFKQSSLYIWDEYHASVQKSLDFPSDIKKVLVRREFIVIILEFSAVVYSTNTWKKIAEIDTVSNVCGVCAISQSGSLVVLLPGMEAGQIRIENVEKYSYVCSNMHRNPVNCVSVNFEGTIGVSSSEYGTVIRVFLCETLQVMHELRRGTISAKICSLSFSKDSSYLIAASNKATVHIWNLQILESEAKKSWLLPTYFQYQRSYFKVHITPELLWVSEDTSQSGPSVCFTEEAQLFIAHLDGNVYSYELVNNEPKEKSVNSFLDFEEEFIEDDIEWTSLE